MHARACPVSQALNTASCTARHAQGSYRACNRIGIESSVSPFLKMSFETAAHFLTEATLKASVDDMRTPSARLCMGQVSAVEGMRAPRAQDVGTITEFAAMQRPLLCLGQRAEPPANSGADKVGLPWVRSSLG